MDCAELYIAIVTLLSSLAALGVAYASLRIAKQVAILNSGSFKPRFYINFLEDGIEVRNKDANLYDMQMVTVAVIQHIGVDLYNMGISIDIPLVLHSRCLGNTSDYNSVLVKSSFLYKDCDRLLFEYGDTELSLRETPNSVISAVKDVVDKEYGFENQERKGYASPGMAYAEYLVSINYLTKHQEHRQYNLYRRGPSHGAGELRWEISEEEFDQRLTQNCIPFFENAQDLIDYCIAHRQIEL